LPNPSLDIRDSLRLNPALARLGGPGLERLAAAATLARFITGDTVFRRGEPADRLYQVAGGRVDLLLDDESGNRTRVESVAAPRLLGLSGMLGEGVYACTASAESEWALLVSLPAALVLDTLRTHPEATKALLAETSMRLRRLVGQLGDLKLRDSVQRLAGYLVDLAATEAAAAEITLPGEKRALADRLGMKPETLSRSLARLEALGLAMPQDGRLHLPDIARLRRLYLAGEAAEHA
jgi:CRP/FNR family transcriptional activator FtrB